VQLKAEKEILIAVASLVHCCEIKKNVIVASLVIRCCRCSFHTVLSLL